MFLLLKQMFEEPMYSCSKLNCNMSYPADVKQSYIDPIDNIERTKKRITMSFSVHNCGSCIWTLNCDCSPNETQYLCLNCDLKIPVEQHPHYYIWKDVI